MGSARVTPEVTNLGASNSTSVPEAVVEPLAATARSVQATPVAPVGQSKSGLEPVLTQIASIADPFAGFVGHCFLRFCLFVEMLSRWVRQEAGAAESLLKSPTHASLRHWGTCLVGTVCCTVVAAGLIPLFYSSSIKSFLPLAFLLIVAAIAFRFGRLAGTLGTLAAAFLFAYFLFEPAGLAVGDPVARSYLIWMLILGVVVSDLLARFKVRLLSNRV